MKLGHDFGRTPFGLHQVLAHARRRRGFGHETAAVIGANALASSPRKRQVILEIDRPRTIGRGTVVATAQEAIPAGAYIEIDCLTGKARVASPIADGTADLWNLLDALVAQRPACPSFECTHPHCKRIRAVRRAAQAASAA